MPIARYSFCLFSLVLMVSCSPKAKQPQPSTKSSSLTMFLPASAVSYIWLSDQGGAYTLYKKSQFYSASLSGSLVPLTSSTSLSDKQLLATIEGVGSRLGIFGRRSTALLAEQVLVYAHSSSNQAMGGLTTLIKLKPRVSLSAVLSQLVDAFHEGNLQVHTVSPKSFRVKQGRETVFTVLASSRFIAISNSAQELQRIAGLSTQPSKEGADIGWHRLSSRPQYRMVEPARQDANHFMSIYIDGQTTVANLPKIVQRLAKEKSLPLALRMDAAATGGAITNTIAIALSGLNQALGSNKVARETRLLGDGQSILSASLSQPAIAGLIRLFSSTSATTSFQDLSIYLSPFEQLGASLIPSKSDSLGIDLMVSARTLSPTSLLPGIKSGIELLLSSTGMPPAWAETPIGQGTILSSELPVGIGIHLWQNQNMLELSTSKTALTAMVKKRSAQPEPTSAKQNKNASLRARSGLPLANLHLDGIAIFNLVNEGIKQGIIGKGESLPNEAKNAARMIGTLDADLYAQGDVLFASVQRQSMPSLPKN